MLHRIIIARFQGELGEEDKEREREREKERAIRLIQSACPPFRFTVLELLAQLLRLQFLVVVCIDLLVVAKFDISV